MNIKQSHLPLRALRLGWRFSAGLRPCMLGIVAAVATMLTPFSSQAGDDMRIKPTLKADKIDQRIKTDRITPSKADIEDKPVVMLTPPTASRPAAEAGKVTSSGTTDRVGKTRRVASQ